MKARALAAAVLLRRALAAGRGRRRPVGRRRAHPRVAGRNRAGPPLQRPRGLSSGCSRAIGRPDAGAELHGARVPARRHARGRDRARPPAARRHACPGLGHQVLLDVFVEYGDRARIASWQLDVKRIDDASGGSPTKNGSRRSRTSTACRSTRPASSAPETSPFGPKISSCGWSTGWSSRSTPTRASPAWC